MDVFTEVSSSFLFPEIPCYPDLPRRNTASGGIHNPASTIPKSIALAQT